MRRHRAVMHGDDPVLLCGGRWTALTIATWGGDLVTCPRCRAASVAGYRAVKGGPRGMLELSPPSNDCRDNGECFHGCEPEVDDLDDGAEGDKEPRDA